MITFQGELKNSKNINVKVLVIKCNREKEIDIHGRGIVEKNFGMAEIWAESKNNGIESIFSFRNQYHTYVFITFTNHMSQRGTTLHQHFSGLKPFHDNIGFAVIKKTEILETMDFLLNNQVIEISDWEIPDPKDF